MRVGTKLHKMHSDAISRPCVVSAHTPLRRKARDVVAFPLVCRLTDK